MDDNFLNGWGQDYWSGNEKRMFSAVVAILNGIPDLAWLKDEKSRYIAVNDAFCRFHGIHERDIIDKTDMDLFSGEFALRSMSEDHTVMSTNARQFREEVLRSEDGTEIWMEIVKTPIYSADGEAFGTAGIARDITEYRKKNLDLEQMTAQLGEELAVRKRTEDLLLEQRDRFEVTLASIGDGVITTDGRGSIVFMNPVAESLTGWSAVEALGKPIEDVFRIVNEETKGAVKNPVERVLAEGVVIGFANHTCLIAKDGREIPIGDSGSPIRNRDGTIGGVILVFRDMSSKLRTERRLAQARVQLLHSEKLASIGQLAAGVAHEINNPLGYIISNFETLVRYVESMKKAIGRYRACDVGAPGKNPEKDPDLDAVLDDIDVLLGDNREGMLRIRDIVKNLKNFAAPDNAGKKDYTDLNAAVTNTLLIAKNETRYVAEMVVRLGEIPLLYCNINEINQVLLNLLINAAHAIKEKKAEKPGTISIETREEEGRIVCSVTDTGTGMPPETVKRVFDPFYTTKEPGKGTGLGLTMAYDIVVNRHNGEIRVESEPGNGSTFTLVFPGKPG